ncbi:unnamed protein product [Caenorhabditis bovis]|uniref:Uncharacterized protein n=1 Tax=Caenorhabditis bovis TaxID=2654633 RepID=A0A8S1ECR5_9PELO|nr:unnamed protein product [Caenorhabditis bovis]
MALKFILGLALVAAVSCYSAYSPQVYWKCYAIKTFIPDSKLITFQPNIAYYEEDGIEKAVVVCDDKPPSAILAQWPNTTPDAEKSDIAILSYGSRTTYVAECNEETKRYEAKNVLTGKTIPFSKVACANLFDFSGGSS